MSIATHEREIDGHRYTVSQLPAMRALRLLNRFGRIAGPSLARMAGGEGRDDTFAQAVQELFDRLPDDEMEAVVRELLSAALADGKELLPQFDLHFQGRMGALVQVLRFALEANYGSFFGELAAASHALRTAPRSAGSSTSSGPSGGSS